MLILEWSQGCYGRMDGSVTGISLRNFVGERITRRPEEHVGMYVYFVYPAA